MQRESKEQTGFAVECPNHGLVYMTPEFYNVQMMNADDLWRCPICNEESWWPDENYEEYFNIQ